MDRTNKKAIDTKQSDQYISSIKEIIEIDQKLQMLEASETLKVTASSLERPQTSQAINFQTSVKKYPEVDPDEAEFIIKRVNRKPNQQT